MADHSWQTYYRKVDDFPPRPLTRKLAERLSGRPNRTAIDMGCGAGRELGHLLESGFTVHAFDAEEAAVSVCRDPFGDHPGLTLRQCGFAEFDYPPADLILAWASLYFCPQSQFDDVWGKVRAALKPGGWFCGDFLGDRDGLDHR